MTTRRSTHQKTVARLRLAMLPALIAGQFTPASAADWQVTGQLRQEIAVKTTDDQNLNNQTGSAFNGVAVTNHSPPALGLNGVVLQRPASFQEDATFNSFATRLELNFDGRLSDSLKATIKLRGVTEQVAAIESAFGKYPAGYQSGAMYRQEFGGTSGGPLAYANGRTRIDLPAAYLDYNNGPLWIRAGNQQIAWGEALFFRVADQPNGLDLRGHLLGVAAEEYSDTRRASLGLRMNYRVADNVDVDGFVQRFAPTLLPNGETPYNFIPDQFTVRQKAGYDAVANKLNVGFRVKGEAAGFGFQAFAINRRNPDGVFKWTLADGGTAGTPIPQTAFEIAGSGVYSAQEWFSGAARSRLNGIEAVATSMNFVAGGTSDPLGLVGLATLCNAERAELGNFRMGSRAAAECVLDTFFSQFPLRGHISREYKRETVLGGGINHVFEGEPDSLLDQLIGRFEFSYTPNKYFTNPTLGDYIKKNEFQFALILEKYHKFTASFPATYFVAQWLHKTQSDIFGRYLGGVDNAAGTDPKGQGGGFNAVAFALQQPSPTLEYRFDFSVLTDLKGGWYMQPGLRWKPSKAVQADLYWNAVYSQHRGQNRDFVDGMQHNNEIYARLSYQF